MYSIIAKYIEKEVAVKIAEKYGLTDGSVLGRHSGIADCIASEIATLPIADVAPVAHGKWEVIHVKNHWDKARCSACKRVFESYEWGSNYCHVCGAKMDGVDNG